MLTKSAKEITAQSIAIIKLLAANDDLEGIENGEICDRCGEYYDDRYGDYYNGLDVCCHCRPKGGNHE